MGCSSATELSKAVSIICDDTAQLLQEMSNVGCMNYGRTRLQEAMGHTVLQVQVLLNLKQYQVDPPPT